MIITSLQRYWTLVSAHRKGDKLSIAGLKLLSQGSTKEAVLARRYLEGRAA